MYYIYINLDNKTERKKHMENLLSNLNLNFERFKAVKPSLDDIQNKKLVPRVKKYLEFDNLISRGLGLIGCYLSHYNILKKIKNYNYNNICILEDDVNFDKITINKMVKIIKYLNSNLDWDIIRSLKEKEFILKNYKNKFKLVSVVDNIKVYKFNSVNKQSIFAKKNINDFHYGTHYQIINRKNLENIIKYLNEDYLYNIDSVYSTNRINIYFVFDEDINIQTDYLNDISSIPKSTIEKFSYSNKKTY